MKTVFDTRQCAHVWAQRSQPHGRNPGNSVHFDGAVFYSYSTPIANWAPLNKRDPRRYVALISSHSYSVTTNGKHLPAVHRAIGGGQAAFIVPDVGAQGGRAHTALTGPASDPASWSAVHRANRDWMVAEYRAFVERCLRQRNGMDVSYSDYQMARIEAHALNIKEYCELTGVTFPAAIKWREDADKVAQRNQRLRAANDSPDAVRKREQAAAARARKAERDEALRVADAATRRRAWLDGTLHSLPYGETTFEGGALLRVKGSEVQTSMGARVPVSGALLLLRTVENWRASCAVASVAARIPGQTLKFERGAVKIGDFEVRTISPTGDIQVGCHFIKWEEIARVAAEIREAASKPFVRPAGA